MVSACVSPCLMTDCSHTIQYDSPTCLIPSHFCFHVRSCSACKKRLSLSERILYSTVWPLSPQEITSISRQTYLLILIPKRSSITNDNCIISGDWIILTIARAYRSSVHSFFVSADDVLPWCNTST